MSVSVNVNVIGEINVRDCWIISLIRIFNCFNLFNVTFIMNNCFISAIFNVIMDNAKGIFVMNSLD
mgnify:CR=1 FL=1